jgi:hypothetical protein
MVQSGLVAIVVIPGAASCGLYSPDPASISSCFSTYLRQREGIVHPYVGVFGLRIRQEDILMSKGLQLEKPVKEFGDVLHLD